MPVRPKLYTILSINTRHIVTINIKSYVYTFMAMCSFYFDDVWMMFSVVRWFLDDDSKLLFGVTEAKIKKPSVKQTRAIEFKIHN